MKRPTITTLTAGLTIAAGLLLVALVAACSNPGKPPVTKTKVIAIDRTGSTAHFKSWPREVAGIVSEQTTQAFADRVNSIVLLSIGSNTADTAKVATFPLKLDCSNDNVCNDERANLATQAGDAAAQVAVAPVSSSGTDIIAALTTARAICGTNLCEVTLVTDGQDGRLSEPGTVEQLVERHIKEFPHLTGIVVHLVGLGADGSNAEAVDRAREFWQVSLTQAAASDIVIARSL